MNNVLRIERRNVYGNELIYPDNLQASLFTQLMNKKTLSENDLKLIKNLGFKVLEKNEVDLTPCAN